MRHLILTLLMSVLAVCSGKDALLAYARSQPLEDWHRLLDDDPVIAVVTADARLTDPARLAAETGPIHDHARAALALDPLNAPAMRQLGMIATLQKSGRGQGQLALAEKISRRDLVAQLLLSDGAARGGDVAATLAHYDRALSVYPETGKALYPVLARASSDQDIRTAIVRYASRPWFVGLTATAIDAGQDTAAAAKLLDAARLELPAAELQHLYTRLLQKLVVQGQYGEARALAGQIPGTKPAALDKIGFSETDLDPRLAPLSWMSANGNGVAVTPTAPAGLEIRLASDQTAVLAERVTMLAPNTYELTQALRYEPGTPQARLTWEVQCLAPDHALIWRQLVPAQSGVVTYRSRFTVPASCAAQRWRLSGTADVGQTDSEARLERLELVRLP